MECFYVDTGDFNFVGAEGFGNHCAERSLVDIRLLAVFFQSDPERLIGGILVLVGCREVLDVFDSISESSKVLLVLSLLVVVGSFGGHDRFLFALLSGWDVDDLKSRLEPI